MITAQVNTESVACGMLISAAVMGLKRHGVGIRLDAARGDAGDFTLCWGMRRAAKPLARGRRVLIMERGYIGDRMRWTSLAWNGLNGRGDFRLPDGAMPERFARLFKMKAWKAGGRRVLIMGQVPGDMSLAGVDLAGWYREAAIAAAEAYGLPAVFRPHPRAIALGRARPAAGDVGGPLGEVLESCAAVVTWNSNSGVDAVLAGVPTITIDRGAMAWPVTSHTIGDLARPDRLEWANRLAWCQWSPEELAGGAWWDRLKNGLEAV